MSEMSDSSEVSRQSSVPPLLFLTIVFVAIVLISFSYGLMKGMSRRGAVARASFAGAPELQIDNVIQRELPPGARLVPLGSDVTINGRDAHIAMFNTDSSPSQVINYLSSRWKRLGYRVGDRGGPVRAVAVAVDTDSGRRFAVSAWSVPKPLRRDSDNSPVQGILSVSLGFQELRDRPIDDSSAEVPGIPPMPGGQVGSLFSSRDPGGRSYTGVYTNPFTVEDSISYYRKTLLDGGWSEKLGQLDGTPLGGIDSLVFQRGGREAILIFTPAPKVSVEARSDERASSERRSPAFDDSRTVATITVGPDLTIY